MNIRFHSQISDLQMRWFARLNFWLIFFALLTMLLGPLVRAEGAGLACPDWPLCKGKLIPEMDYQVALEWLHRSVAAALSIIVFVWAGLGLYSAKVRRGYAWIIISALALLVLQIVLGALTITEALDAYIVSSHLLNAVLFLSLLTYSWHKSWRNHGQPWPKAKVKEKEKAYPSVRFNSMRFASACFLFLVFVQIFLGVRVSANQAGRVCNAFPACYNEAVIDAQGDLKFEPQYFPPMEGNLEKHMSHRFMAYLLFIALLVLTWLTYKGQGYRRLLRLVLLIFALVLVQIVIGALNVIFAVPVAVTVLHSLFAYAVYLSTFWLFLETKLVNPA